MNNFLSDITHRARLLIAAEFLAHHADQILPSHKRCSRDSVQWFDNSKHGQLEWPGPRRQRLAGFYRFAVERCKRPKASVNDGPKAP